MITTDQLLESVDLDFEPGWVTKDECGEIAIWTCKKPAIENNGRWCGSIHIYCPKLKLAEFSDKPWQECIYEVPRKTTGKIEKLPTSALFGCQGDWREKINELVDYVNALIESNNIHEKQIDEIQMKLEPEKCAVNELKGGEK